MLQKSSYDQETCEKLTVSSSTCEGDIEAVIPSSSVKDGKYICGGFEPISKPVDFENLPAIGRGLLPVDWDHFSVLLNEMLFRMPDLVKVEVDKLYNSPESFTPDGRWLVGESAEVRSLTNSSRNT